MELARSCQKNPNKPLESSNSILGAFAKIFKTLCESKLHTSKTVAMRVVRLGFDLDLDRCRAFRDGLDFGRDQMCIFRIVGL